MARIMSGNAWVNDKFVPVTFIQAKDCNFKKSNFEAVLKADDEACTADSEIQQGYMKHRVGHHPEYGYDGYWEMCEETERGASMFYYAETKHVD